MRRLAVAVLIAVLMAAASAAAMPPKGKHAPAKHPGAGAPEEQVYEASGPSAYCLEHPSQCKEKHPEDRPVGGRMQHCVDVYGNGDGFVSQWEIANFGERCR